MQRNLPGIPPSAALQQLSEHFEHAGFFDIETANEGGITLIACLQGGNLHTFVRGENLEDFLMLLDDIPLLVSFNGKLFDVPQVLEYFHVPALPCAHLDLRYACKSHGLTGGLKKIEKTLGIGRPLDLQGLDGEDALWLWRAWEHDHDESARRRLIRYCRADVIGLREIAVHLLDQHVKAFVEPPMSLWPLLEADSKFRISDSKLEGRESGICNVESGIKCASPLYERLRTKVRMAARQRHSK